MRELTRSEVELLTGPAIAKKRPLFLCIAYDSNEGEWVFSASRDGFVAICETAQRAHTWTQNLIDYPTFRMYEIDLP